MSNKPPLTPFGVVPWEEDTVEELRKLWAAGQSASQIAKALGGGKTRNAVIGKVHRLKLTQRLSSKRVYTEKPPKQPKVIREPKPPKVARLSVSFPLAAPLVPSSFEPLPSSKPTTLTDATGCMWPIGDHGLFCNAGRESGSHYCPHHHSRAYKKAA